MGLLDSMKINNIEKQNFYRSTTIGTHISRHVTVNYAHQLAEVVEKYNHDIENIVLFSKDAKDKPQNVKGGCMMIVTSTSNLIYDFSEHGIDTSKLGWRYIDEFADVLRVKFNLRTVSRRTFQEQIASSDKQYWNDNYSPVRIELAK